MNRRPKSLQAGLGKLHMETYKQRFKKKRKRKRARKRERFKRGKKEELWELSEGEQNFQFAGDRRNRNKGG